MKKMKLGKMEKRAMISQKHAEHGIEHIERLLPYVNLKENQNYLEVGCGNGHTCKYLARKYHLNVTGTDVDPEMVQFAKENIDDIPRIRFLEMDATKMPFQDNDFDIVLSFGVMHHIPNWLEAVKEIKRVLKPEGYFIYFDVIFPNWLARIGKLFKHSYGITTIHDLSSFIEENNFSTIHSSLSKSLLWNQYEAVYQRSEL